MIVLTEKQEIIKTKVEELTKIIDENELTYCSNDLKVLVHEIKGLCGLFGYLDLFNLFYEMERILEINNFELLKSKVEELKNKDLFHIEQNISKITYRHVFNYELSFCFISITQFNHIIEIISDCAVILYSMVLNRQIILYVYSYCDKKAMDMLCNTYKVSVKFKKIDQRKNENFVEKIAINNNCFNDKYLHLFLLESITNISQIANKKFDFYYSSNEFTLKNSILSDNYIVFAELIKNVFSHSGRKDFDFIKIKCIKKDKFLFIKIYNSGNKIKRKIRKKIFAQNYSTSRSNALSGQGIGLYDVKRLLLSHNGKISFRNKLRGVLFTIKIPIDIY
ncbi:MAG: sensor histidine kinase [Erysipelotrichales bacterium]|nr:sensor histidine kinase [Erysipelotrichales bacterium]